MSTFTYRSLPALAVALAAFAGLYAGPAAAQQSGAAIITQYEGAAEAMDQCGTKLTDAQTLRVAGLEQERGAASIPTGDALALRQQGRDSTRVRRFGLNGCNDPIVQERLNFFRTTIQPSL
jgi:hypothetical protein